MTTALAGAPLFLRPPCDDRNTLTDVTGWPLGVEVVRLDDHPEPTRAARAHVQAQLAEASSHVLTSDAQLVASELVANAVLHGAAPVVLMVDAEPTRVRIVVRDAGRGVPVRSAEASSGSMTGRGLRLIEAVSAAWGVMPVDGGKAVWAELAT